MNYRKSIFSTFLFCCCLLAGAGAKAQSLKYVWAKNMGGISDDRGYALATDAVGNVYTIGHFDSTADFDPGPGTAILSSSGDDVFIAKYDAGGNYVWAKSISGGGADMGWGIGVDALGNVYISGFFYETVDFDPGPGTASLTSQGGSDIFLAKYDANGNYVWAHSFGDVGPQLSFGLTVDQAGNVLMTGYFAGTVDFDAGPGSAILTTLTPTTSNVFLAKYDTNGNYIWAKGMGNTGTTWGYRVTTDATGNAYITGYFSGTVDFDPGAGTANLSAGIYADAYLAKYDVNGNYVWAKRVGGSGGFDFGYGVAVSTTGKVILTGKFESTADFDPGPGTASLTSAGGDDIFIAQYSATGDYMWAKRVGAAGGDRSYAAAVDTAGNVFVTGYFSGTVDFDPGPGTASFTAVTSQEQFLAMYDSSGNYVWASGIGGSGDDRGQAISFDGHGSIYVTGYFGGSRDFDPGTGTATLTSTGIQDMFVLRMYEGCKSFSYLNQIACDSFSYGGTTYTVSGVYSNTYTNAAACDSIATLYLTINHSTSQTVTAHYCDSVALNGITYTTSGVYTQTLTSTSGCDSVVTYDLTIGAGNGIQLTETACDSFIFNDTTIFFTSGIHTITLTNSTGCDSVITLNLTIVSPVASITENGAVLTATMADSYQWIECDDNLPIAGATSQNYTVLVAGSYAVEIIIDGCSDRSPCIDAQPVGISGPDAADNKIYLFPNPASDKVTVQWQRGIRDATIRLVSILGKTLWQQEGITGNTAVIDLSPYAAGTYIVEITEGGQAARAKITRQQRR